MPTSDTKKKATHVHSRCEDLMNDFSLPEEHKDRFVSIDLTSNTGNGNSITSSPTSTPGARSTMAKGAESVNTRSKRAWDRAIDKYVASVLEDEVVASGGELSSSIATDKVSNTPGSRSSRRSQRSSRLQHPDNHLLAALQRDMTRTPSSAARPSSRSSRNSVVDIDGHIDDDSSFAPINPFDLDEDEDAEPGNNGMSRRLKRLKNYMSEEWKPISLIVLVVLVTIIVSVSVSNRDASSAGGGGNSGSPGYAIDTAPKDIKVISTTAAPSSEFPTYSPTVLDDEEDTKSVVVSTSTTTTKATTTTSTLTTTTVRVPTVIKPTSSPTPAPTSQPSVEPTISMPSEYFDMKKAAVYVTGTEGPFDSTSSPQSLAFNWLYYEGKPSKNIFEFFEQYATAVVFFSLTRARTLHALVNNVTTGRAVYDEWTKTTEICGWEGVRCAYNYTSEMIHVTELRLSNRSLTGTIPNEIEFLPYLNRLDLSDNEVSGTVPEGVYDLKRLR